MQKIRVFEAFLEKKCYIFVYNEKMHYICIEIN